VHTRPADDNSRNDYNDFLAWTDFHHYEYIHDKLNDDLARHNDAPASC
jgi:hypothetical protein